MATLGPISLPPHIRSPIETTTLLRWSSCSDVAALENLAREDLPATTGRWDPFRIRPPAPRRHLEDGTAPKDSRTYGSRVSFHLIVACGLTGASFFDPAAGRPRQRQIRHAYCVLTATEVSPRSTPPLSVKATKTRLTPGEFATAALPVTKMPKVGVALG
jgi:hypothetical protein